MAVVSFVRWAMLAMLLGAYLLATEGAATPGEAAGEPGTAASVSASSVSAASTAEGVTRARTRTRRSTAPEEEDSEYINDEADYEDEGTGEEEEESSPAPPPIFLSTSITLSLRPGDNATLPCRVDSIGNAVQMWLNGSLTLTVGDSILGDKRIQRLPDMSLFIQSVKPEDTGAYTCQIVSQPIVNLTHYLKVPAPAKILSHSQKQIVALGQTLTLNCAVWGSPHPTVKWTLQNKDVPDATYSADGSVLTVNSVTKMHGGQYKCIADNNAGHPVDATMLVTVSTKPQVTVVRDLIRKGEGETVELFCTVSGQPKPRVKWFADGEELEIGSSRFEVSAINTTYILRIKNLEKTDFGVYSCSAKNKFGTTQKNITLSGAPGTPKYLGYKIENDKVILKWDVESYAPIELYELKYRKQGEVEWKTVNPPVSNADGDIYSAVIELLDVSAGDHEAYFRSKNEFGWTDSQPVVFKGSEKHKEEDESSSIGPENDSGASICTLSAAFLTALIFRTFSSYL